MYCICLFGICHAARVSEIAQLRLSDVNLVKGLVMVRRKKGSNSTLQSLFCLPSMNEKEAFAEYIAARKAAGADDNSFLFAGRRQGEHVNRSTIFRCFQEVALAAGIPKELAHCHVMKHTHARLLVRQNISLPLIQTQLGHRSITSTAVYSRPTESEASEAAQAAFSRLFTPQGA
jgi:site-specific recombinase XerD